MEYRIIKTDLLILGKSGVALSAIRTIRSKNNNIGIAVVSKEEGSFYSPVVLPYYILGSVSKRALFPLDAYYFSNKSVDTFFGRRIIKLNAKKKQVFLDDGTRIDYGKVIIGTGASPFVPKVKGIKNSGVFSLRTLRDAEKILKQLRKKVVIMGAGAVAIGIATAFCKKGIDVTIVYRRGLANIIGGRVDNEIGEEVLKNLKENGIRVVFNQTPLEMEIVGDPVRGIRGKNLELKCDTIIVATGVKANTDFVDPNEISIGDKGGILVDNKMMSSAKDVYAAGDCVEAVNFVTGEKGTNPTWPSAIEQGKIAALNALNVECQYQGFIKANVINLFEKCLFIAGEMSGDRKHFDEKGKKWCISIKDGIVSGCQVFGVPDKFGVYLGMIKNRFLANKMVIPMTRLEVVNPSWTMLKKILRV